MMCSTTQKIKQYDGKICSVRGKFKMTTTVGQVDKGVPLAVPNPRYTEKINKYPHLEGVAMGNDDAKPELLIHLTDWDYRVHHCRTNLKKFTIL